MNNKIKKIEENDINNIKNEFLNKFIEGDHLFFQKLITTQYLKNINEKSMDNLFELLNTIKLNEKNKENLNNHIMTKVISTNNIALCDYVLDKKYLKLNNIILSKIKNNELLNHLCLNHQNKSSNENDNLIIEFNILMNKELPKDEKEIDKKKEEINHILKKIKSKKSVTKKILNNIFYYNNENNLNNYKLIKPEFKYFEDYSFLQKDIKKSTFEELYKKCKILTINENNDEFNKKIFKNLLNKLNFIFYSQIAYNYKKQGIYVYEPWGIDSHHSKVHLMKPAIYFYQISRLTNDINIVFEIVNNLYSIENFKNREENIKLIKNFNMNKIVNKKFSSYYDNKDNNEQKNIIIEKANTLLEKLFLNNSLKINIKEKENVINKL